MNTKAPSVLIGSSLNLQVTGSGIGPDRIIRLLFAVQRRCCSYSVWLCGLYHGALQFLVSCFFSPFSIVFSSLGEEGLVYVLLVHLFVYFARATFCPFSLPLDVRGGRWLLIVALSDCSTSITFLAHMSRRLIGELIV